MGENSAEMLNEAGIPFGELIRKFRKRKGLSQEQLGALAGVKKNAVGAWEAGRSRPDVASVPILCRALGIPLSQFFGTKEEKNASYLYERFIRLTPSQREAILRQMDRLYELQHQESRKPRELIKLYQNDISAAAGPVSYLDEHHGEMVYLISDEITRYSDEIIRVSGDSMEPSFMDGDWVLVQHTARIQEGEIGIFVNGQSGYIKEYRKDGLYSHNPRYTPIRFSEEDSVRCIGKVLGLLRPEQRATSEDIEAFTASEV